MTQLLSFERRDVVRWALAVLCGGWLFGSIWYVLTISPTRIQLDATGAYVPYERQLADCNELRGSQAKYDCTSKLMLGRDRSLFGKIAIVVLPPLALIGFAGIYSFAGRLRVERERERVARDSYEAQMEAYREKRAAEEAEIAAGVHKEEMFLDDDGNLVEPPSRFARWKDDPAS